VALARYTTSRAGVQWTGGVVSDEKVVVKIPPGITDGARLRLKGMGDYAKGGTGDLFVEVHVLEHNIFKERG